MQTTKPYRYGGKTFGSLKAIREHVQAVIDYDNRVIDREFWDDVLADLVVDRHYRWSMRGVRPTAFKFVRNQEGDNRSWGSSLAGYFEGWGWCRFSYRNLLKKEQSTLQTKFPDMCHERWASIWRGRLFGLGGLCAHADCSAPATDVDHIDPQHKEIIARCWEVLSDEDRAAWWSRLIEESPDAPHFILPEGHAVTRLYDEMTEQGSYQLLCAEHHHAISGQRARRQVH